MKVTPLAPAASQTQQTTNNTDSRAKAMAAFLGGEAKPQVQAPVQTAQEYPVANANNISAEEVSAIKAPTQEVDNSTSTEATQIETKAEETKPEAKDPVLERQFQELARQERILRAKAQKQQQELQAQKAALDAQKQALDVRSQEYDKGYISKDRLKADPLSVLAEAELSYDELTQRLLNQQPRDPRTDAHISKLEATIAKLEARLDEGQKNSETQQQEQYKAAVRQIERDAQNLVKQDPEAYEAISKTNSVRDVVELIEETYKKDGILLSVEEAAKEVEDYLVEEGVNTFSKIEKIKKRLSEAAASTAAPQKVVEKTQAKPEATQPTMKTLTNATSSTRKLSARERALLAFKNELKG